MENYALLLQIISLYSYNICSSDFHGRLYTLQIAHLYQLRFIMVPLIIMANCVRLLVADCAIIGLHVRSRIRLPSRAYHRDVATVSRVLPLGAVVILVASARELRGGHDLGEEAHEEDADSWHACTDHADADLNRGPD